MSKDKIIIVRHGRPSLSKAVWLTWRGYADWWKQYDAGGLVPNQKVPQKVKDLASQSDIVISSSLRRAIESAEMITGKAPDLIDPNLVEAPLPPPHLGPIKFRPRTWGAIARIVWYFGWSDGQETHSQARARANAMSETLAAHAAGGKTVFVTAHGWYNRMLKGSLMKQGWKCVSQNGDMHWSHRRFERDTVDK